MSGRTKLLLGGAGLGAVGVGVMAARRRKRDKEASVQELAIEVMRGAIIKKAGELYRREAATVLCGYLDNLAGRMSLEKTASVRKLQTAVAEGQELSTAIKLAYPQLHGEQRGILASKLVTAAYAAYAKRAEGSSNR